MAAAAFVSPPINKLTTIGKSLIFALIIFYLILMKKLISVKLVSAASDSNRVRSQIHYYCDASVVATGAAPADAGAATMHSGHSPSVQLRGIPRCRKMAFKYVSAV